MATKIWILSLYACLFSRFLLFLYEQIQAGNLYATETMNIDRLTLALKRPFIWLRRFRHRRGYGVHSPFAFDFITDVVFERSAYYKYKELRIREKQLKRGKGSDWLYEPPKLKRLLFRLVNYARPETIVDAGRLSASSLYLKAARVGADYVGATDLSGLFLEAGVPVDFLYLHDYRRPDFVQQTFEVCVSRTTGRSLFVIEGVRYTPEMTALWKRLRKHERVGVTFDLYDLGILFFDKSKAKQDYIVNYSHPFSL